MTALKKAPLIYTLCMIQFPKIPNIERFADFFLDEIRSEYPFVNQVRIPVFNADFSLQGVQMGQHESRIWQFTSIDRKWGFSLTDQVLCLHTIDYKNFFDFSQRFQKGLECFLNIPDIGIEWMTALGIRYVNLVSSDNKHSLRDFLNPWVLPHKMPSQNLHIIEGAYVNRYKTELGELRLQSLLNPQFTLPPDLQSPLIVKNGWIRNRPLVDFALVDIDHCISQPLNMKVKDAIKQLKNLRGLSKEVFLSTGTEFALNSWR